METPAALGIIAGSGVYPLLLADAARACGEDPSIGGESSGTFTTVKLPATFWITNPSNAFIDNAAAGSSLGAAKVWRGICAGD